MPEPHWTDIAQGVGAIGGLLLGVVGFAAIWFQIKQVQQAIRADTLERLYLHGFEIIRFMADHPETRPYIFEGQSLSPGDPDTNNVIAVLEMGADYLQHIANLRHLIDEDSWQYWACYGRDLFANCPAAYEYLARRRHWYTPELFDLIGMPRNAPSPGTNAPEPL